MNTSIHKKLKGKLTLYLETRDCYDHIKIVLM